ncbi:formin-like protein 2 [Lactuca sativa]|uniref:Formin-like protein n=1 Tax=Lactuca sativa TaxID=4236 RepID=A0A9R1WFN3_LACSA|nr:formin-like protein 2 [Lactuca sativa]KAJ0224446.1 hypothetical protein LSAT_V11C100030470 [Lactuca sativa]
MAPQIIFLLLLLLLLLSSHSSSSRRILHQPFFPVIDSPPPPPHVTTQTPSPSPSPSLQPQPQPQPQPKHPFSSLTPPETDNNRRFFPSYTSPPESSTTTTTVPSTSLPTFPANISSIILPSSSSSKSHVSTKLLLISLAFSLLAIAFIAAVVVSLVYHRNHSHKPPPSDSLRLFPANLPTSDKPPPPPTLPPNFSTPSSEFLYLGTLVSPLHDQKLLKTSGHMTNASASAAATSIDYNMLGSPELHPLPPLPRQDFHHQHNLDEGSFTDSEVEDLGDFLSPKGSPVAFQRHKTVLPPPPPPPPPSGFCGTQRKEEILKPKLKPLQWDNVRASSEKATTWDHFKLSSFQLNEETIHTLFMANSSKPASNPGIDQKMVADVTQKNIVLDPHKSRNIVILLRALDLTIDEVCESILQGNVDTLDSELLGSLLKMAPTMEEETRLKEFDDLDPAEKFLKAVIQIPFAFKRVDAMLYILNFDNEVEYLKGSFKTIEMASRELRNSRMFIKLLDAVLMAGTQMNDGTTHALKLDALLKLVHVKGNDGKTTLLHFVVQEIIREEGFHLSGGENNKKSELCDEVEFRKRGLEVVSSLGGELSSVKKAAAMDSTLLSKEVERLAMGLTKVGEVVGLNEQIGSNERFSDSMNVFLKKAKGDLVKIVDQERLSISMVKEATEYFHGEYSAMEEGEALRIFIVVREFLSVLDRVCKDVGKMNERSTVGIPLLRMSQSLPVFPKYNGGQQFGSSDGEDESVSV